MAQFAGGATLGVDYDALIGGSPTYVTVGQVVDINGPSLSAATLDSTVHGGEWREFVPGLKDAGDVSVTIRAETMNVAQLALLENIGDGPFAARVTWPKRDSDNATPRSVSVDAILTAVGSGLPHDGLATMDVTFKVTGAPVWVEESLL